MRTFWPEKKEQGSMWNIIKLPDFKWEDLRSQLKLAFMTLANVLCGIYGLVLVNVPMFIALRRLNSVFVYLYDITVLKKPIVTSIAISIALITVGTVIAAANDLNADFWGYIFVFANNLLTTFQYQWGKKLSDSSQSMNAMTQTYYVSIAGIIPLLFLYLFLEQHDAYLFPWKYETNFMGSLFLCSILGFFISLGINMNNTINSPLTVTITGETKNIFGTLIGIFAFGDVICTKELLAGLFLCTLGSILYVHTKYRQLMSSKTITGK